VLIVPAGVLGRLMRFVVAGAIRRDRSALIPRGRHA
jgi:hypothetical protein